MASVFFKFNYTKEENKELNETKTIIVPQLNVVDKIVEGGVTTFFVKNLGSGANYDKVVSLSGVTSLEMLYPQGTWTGNTWGELLRVTITSYNGKRLNTANVRHINPHDICSIRTEKGETTITTNNRVSAGQYNGFEIYKTASTINDMGTIINALPTQSGGILDAPANGTTYGRNNNAWVAVVGGTPAGSDTQIQYNNAGSFGADAGFFKGDETFGLGLLHTQQSAVTFTGSGLDDLIVLGLFTGTVPTTYTVTVASTGTPDTFDWTDGTNSGTGVSMSTSPISLSNGISISFGADTGHTLTESWTWDYTTVNQNVLDFSNNDYKFQSTFGTDTFGYQIGDNLLGYGLKGALNTYTNTGGDFGLLGFASFGGISGSTNQLSFSGGETASTYLAKNQYDIEVGNGTDKFLQSITPVTFSYINIIGGIEYGIEQSAGVVTIGNRTGGGNNTKITVDDVNEHITISNLPAYDDDTAAGVAGLTAGMVYMTTGSGSAPLNAAGILMIKQ